MLKPVYDNWYITGQLQRNHLDLIYENGLRFPHIILTRHGETTDDTPTKEEVTLLNIEDDTGTYIGDGRQTVDRLLKMRLNPSLPAAYVTWNSTTNYESSNHFEFGDDIGFNLTLMIDEVTARLPYSPRRIHHTPFGKFSENFGELAYLKMAY